METQHRINLQLFAGDMEPPEEPEMEPPEGEEPLAEPLASTEPPAAEPPEPEFEIEPGQKVKLSDIRAWQKAANDYQKLTPEYTRSRQQLADLQRQLEQTSQLAQWAQRIQSDPEIMALLDEAMAASGRVRLEDLPPEVQQVVKIGQQQSFRQSIDQAYSQAVEAVGGLPEGFDENAFWASAAENNVPPDRLGMALAQSVTAHLRQQLADLPAKIAAAEKAGFDKAVAQFRQKGAAGIAAGTGTGGGAAAPAAPADKPASYAEIARARIAAGGALFTDD